MTHISNKERPARRYRSELRAQQAEDTRARILDAALRVMADGFASVSIPNVAREAGVSVPTVYRHFRTKQDLLDAIYPHVVSRSGTPTPPTTIDGIRQGAVEYLDHLDSLDDFARAVMGSPGAEEVRQRSMPRRLEALSRIVDSVEPPLQRRGRERLLRLLLVLSSSGALRLLHEHLGDPTERVAADVDWFVRAAISAARSEEAAP
jgi:AcrR family transcriptional regulator